MPRFQILPGVFAALLALAASAHPLQQWHERVSVPGGQLGFTSVTWGNDLFVAIGGTLAASSPDGENWLVHNTGVTGSLRAVAYGDGQFIAVGLYGLIASSADGTNWASQAPGIQNYHLTDVAFGDGRFVAVGESGRILISSNGTDWFQTNSPTLFNLADVEYGNGLFLIPLGSRTNLLSRDGTNWFAQSSGTSRNLYTVGFGGGLFLAVDTGLDVWTSADATNWSHHGSTTGVRPPCVGWGHDEFVVCSNPTLEYFQNGSWIPAPTNIYAAGIAFGNGTFIVAAGTRLYQSDPVIKFQMLAPGSFHLLGPPGAYTIEVAESLATSMPWQTYTNLFVTESPLDWFDPQPNNAPIRFYRAGFAP